ncbi:MAG: hypothetical protein LBK43_03645 [Treponema sp.]|jgi:hypothetical protein|nr:hypothetical protein [Treponema sp.]
MPGGRPRKPTTQLKLAGTYREDRHGKNPDTLIADLLNIPGELVPPETLIDTYCREHYKYHTNLLINLKILTVSDLPELELLYLTLQQCRQIRERLATLDMLKEPDDYVRFTRILINLSDYFSKVAQKYYISPTARTKLQLDQLNLEKAKQEESITKKLLNKKKA